MPAACGQDDGVVVDAHVFRVDDFVGLDVLQDAVLVYARRVGKGVAPDDGLVRLHGHVHQRAHHTTCGVDTLGVDVCRDTQLFVALQYHGDFLLAGVSGALADAVDGHFDLTGAVDDAFEGAGGGHAEVVVAMGGEYGALHAVHVFHEVLDFCAVFTGQAVARRVGNVDYRGAGFDHGFHHARQVFIVGAAGVFGIELDVLDIALGVLDGRYGAFEDFLAV